MNIIEKNYDEIDERLQKNITQGSIIPRPIAWITTTNNDGTTNLAPFSHFSMLTSTMVSVSILRNSNNEFKDTTRNILKTKEAVIHIPDINLIEQLDISSKPLLPNISEIDLTNLTLTNSKVIKTKAIKDAKIRFEVILENHLELSDYTNTFVQADLLILRIKFAHLNELVFDNEKGYILHEQLRPIARLSGPSYAEIVEIKSFQRKFY